MKTILGIVGMPGAGKSLAITQGKKFAPVVVMGDVIREEALKQGKEINSINLGFVAKELRKTHGEDVVAQRCFQKIQELPENTVIVDGIRSMHELELFQQKFQCILIAVIVPDDLRHERILARKRADDSEELTDILTRDQREIDFGLKQVIDHADYTIDNSGTKQHLEKQCATLFSQLISSKED